MALDQPHDDEDPSSKGEIKNEFECPECGANNPYDDGIRNGDEVRCFYCGMEYRAVKDDGRWKYKEI